MTNIAFCPITEIYNLATDGQPSCLLFSSLVIPTISCPRKGRTVQSSIVQIMEEYTSTDKAPHSLKTPIDQTLRRETVEKDLQIPSRDPISSIRTRSDPGATPSLANLNVHTLNVEEGDESNPHNWPKRTKYIHTIIISLFVFISPASSSMVAPALVTIAHDLHIVQAIQSQLVVSTFVLTYSIGPLLMAPLSEIYGRLPVLQAGSLLYVVFNTACGASRSTAQLLAFRALSGIGASAPLAVSASTCTTWRDMLIQSRWE